MSALAGGKGECEKGGLRKSEIFTLEWWDVHGDMIRLRPEIAKNKDGRMIVLVGELSNIIDRRRGERVESCPYIFHRYGIRIKHYTGRGVPRQTAKQITGHKTDAVCNCYRILNEQDIREGIAQTQAYLAAQKSGHHTDTGPMQENSPSISS